MKYIWIVMLVFLAGSGFGQIKKVEHVVDSIIANCNFNGAVLLAKNGTKQYLKYTGLADRKNEIRFSEKSRFKIFSVTKTFTAVLILQLYERGKVSLDAPISAYYPEYTGEGADKITIRNLLTYSGGRDNQDMEMLAEAYNQTIWPLDTFITRYCSGRLAEVPGAKFRYNNGDYILLGKILEKIYGKSFDQILDEQIIRPLNLKNTKYLRHEDIVRGIDEAYFNHNASTDELYTPTNYYIDNYFSAGAMYSTPEDLLTFDQAIFNNIILKKETVNVMLTAYPHLDDTALGFWVYNKKFGNHDVKIAERQGYGYGHNSDWIHLIDEGVTLILLSNTNTVTLKKMRELIISAYLGK
jgi:CubicO group peptidase (beta-lactamase class C family)